MKQVRMARRSVGDIVSVCRFARPASTARWLLSTTAEEFSPVTTATAHQNGSSTAADRSPR